MRFRVLAFGLVLYTFGASGWAQEPVRADERLALGVRLDELRSKASFPGATVGVMLANGQSITLSTGVADRERNIKLKPGDRMLAGSVGKTYASAVILLAIEDGALKLDDPVKNWLGKEPWYERIPNAQTITLRMLMNHSSGIPEHVLDKDFITAIKANPDKIWAPAELVAYILDKPTLFPAGTGWSYADTNYILAAMVFEKATGERYYDALNRRILKPFKLERTIPSDRRVIADLIPGYPNPRNPFGLAGPTIVDGKSILNPQFEWTGGGVASTALDLAKWAKLLYEGKVLKPASMKELLNGVDASKGRGGSPGERYGLAVQMRPTQWGMSYGHDGWFPGYLTEVVYFPEHQTAIAIQFNTDNQRDMGLSLGGFIEEIAKIVFGSGAARKAA